MKTVGDLLRDADPVRHEQPREEGDRDRIRRTVLAESALPVGPSTWRPRPLAVVVAVTALIGLAALGSQRWLQENAAVQAQMRFEVRLAEEQPAPGLRAVQIPPADRVIYLHEDVLVTNDDIAEATVVPGDGPSDYSIEVRFTDAGAQRMREATSRHIAKPVAILIDGEVVVAPVVRSPIGAVALLTGDYTRADAERIVGGIGRR